MSEEAKLVETFVIANSEHENTLKQDLYINQGCLSEEFAEHSEKFAWYSTAYEIALDHEARLKEELSRLYAKIDAKARNEAKSAGVKLTEKMVENTVITNPEYVTLQEQWLDAKLNTGLLKSARDAMIHRRDMLVSMGANYRAESRSDIALKQEVYKNNL